MSALQQRHPRMVRPFAAAAIALALLATILTGCSEIPGSRGSDTSTVVSAGSAGPASGPRSAGSGTSELAAPPSAMTKSAAGGTGSAADSAQDRLVVRDGTLRLSVKDVTDTAKKVSALAVADGGWVESMQLASDAGGTVPVPQAMTAGGGVASSSGPSGMLNGYVRVRVPSKKLAAFIREVSGFGKVTYQATDSTDVTAQHVDMVARLKNLQQAEADLRRLETRANTVSEVLAVQRELTRVQGEIESLQAQIKLLEEQAAMAAVTVQLQGPEAIVSPAGDDWGFAEALRTAIRAFVTTINVLIVAVGALLPILAIGLLIAWLVVALVRRARRRRAARAQAAEAIEPDVEPVRDDAAPVVPSDTDDPGTGQE